MKYFFTVFVLLPFLSFGQFTGGSDDGFGMGVFCASDLNGGSSPAIALNPIGGTAQFCSNNTEAYSVTLSAGYANSFVWTGPAGSTLSTTSNTFTSGVSNFLFGNTNGNVSVTASNTCSSATLTLPVTAAACGNFTGGNNDGFSVASFCANDLNGTTAPAIALNPIGGTSTFCSNNTEPYSVTLSAGIANAYIWTGPAGTTVGQTIYNQTSGMANLLFGNTNGSVTVTVSNSCTTATGTLPVTASTCGNFVGGNNDGFSFASFCANDLNGTVAPAIALNLISGPSAFCSNNTEGYSVTLSAGLASSFIWTGPGTTTMTQTASGFTSGTANFLFGNTNGSISVTVANACSTANGSIAVAATACGNFAGGNNDGFSMATFCGNDLNGTSAPALTLNPMVGTSQFCSNNTEPYSITVATGLANAYVWTGPPGSSLAQTAFNSSTGIANFLFAAANGNVSVTVANGCSSATSSLPVTATACGNFVGGNNDGFTFAAFCGDNLNGASSAAITLGPITGGANYCFNLGQNYSVTVTAGTAATYQWSGPPTASIAGSMNTLTTSLTTINFITTNGNVQVIASNACFTANASLAVTGLNCGNMIGGSNDGFAIGTAVNIPLPITLVSFQAIVNKNQVELEWVTESETNNDYFTVQRSTDAQEFEVIATVPGAGTSQATHKYNAVDKAPYEGLSYYRLKQTDFDGRAIYSKLVAINFNGEDLFVFEIFPNPTSGQSVNLVFSPKWEGQVTTIQINDITGRSVISTTITCKPIVPFSTGNQLLKPGVYLITISFDNRKFVRKMIVQ